MHLHFIAFGTVTVSHFRLMIYIYMYVLIYIYIRLLFSFVFLSAGPATDEWGLTDVLYLDFPGEWIAASDT